MTPPHLLQQYLWIGEDQSPVNQSLSVGPRCSVYVLFVHQWGACREPQCTVHKMCNVSEVIYPREATIFASCCAVIFCFIGVLGTYPRAVSGSIVLISMVYSLQGISWPSLRWFDVQVFVLILRRFSCLVCASPIFCSARWTSPSLHPDTSMKPGRWETCCANCFLCCFMEMLLYRCWIWLPLLWIGMFSFCPCWWRTE